MAAPSIASADAIVLTTNQHRHHHRTEAVVINDQNRQERSGLSRSRLALQQYELMLCFKDTDAAARKAERAVENLAGVNGTAPH